MQDINLFKNSPFLGSKCTLVALFALCSTINENKRGPAACSLQLHYLFFSFFHNTCFCLLFRLISTSSLLFPLQTFSLLFLVNWSLAQSLKIAQKCLDFDLLQNAFDLFSNVFQSSCQNCHTYFGAKVQWFENILSSLRSLRCKTRLFRIFFFQIVWYPELWITFAIWFSICYFSIMVKNFVCSTLWFWVVMYIPLSSSVWDLKVESST